MDKIHLKKQPENNASPFFQSVLLPLLRYKRMTYTIVCATLLFTLVYCLIIPNWYTSTATILPTSGGSGLSGLSSFAGSLADLGLGAMMQADENSSAMFPKIIKSRYISDKILDRTYQFNFENKKYSMTFDEYINQDNRDKAIEKLDNLVSIATDKSTGVLKLSVITEYPELSAQVVNAYLDELNDYNVNHRKSKAQENKNFIESRLKEVSTELATAEEKLKEFQEQNRNYNSSSDPALRQEYTNLQREATVKESVMLELTKRFELARVDAAKDLPIVRVIDKGSVPLVKTKPSRTIIMFMALISSLFASVILSLWFEIVRKRGLTNQFNTLLASPEIEMNKFEERVLKSTTHTLNRLKNTIEKTDRTSV